MKKQDPREHKDAHTIENAPAPARYQNHVTRLAWLPQLFQNIEADVTDQETISTGHRRRRGKSVRRTNAQIWPVKKGGQMINNQQHGGQTYYMMALGKDVQAARRAGVAIGIEATAFKAIIKKYQDTTSTNISRAHLFKQISRVFIACVGMMLHDQKTDMFVENPKGTFALVGLRSDGSTRHLNRLKSYMGKHLCSPDLTERLWDILSLLEHTRVVIDGEDFGHMLTMIEGSMQLTGADLNASAPGQHVRGGTWRIAQLNPALTDMSYKKFTQLDTRCFELNDQDFNLYVNIKSQHHMSHGKRTGDVPQRVQFKSHMLLARAGAMQLTQTSTWQERRGLRRALKKMKALGLIEDYGFIKCTRARDMDLWIMLPKRQ